MVFWDRETKNLTCNLPEPISSKQIATLDEFKSKLKSIEGTLGDTLDRVFQGAEDPSTIEDEGSEYQGSTAIGDYEVLNETISKLQKDQILHSKQIQKLRSGFLTFVLGITRNWGLFNAESVQKSSKVK